MLLLDNLTIYNLHIYYFDNVSLLKAHWPLVLYNYLDVLQECPTLTPIINTNATSCFDKDLES